MLLSPAGGFWLLFGVFEGTSIMSLGESAILPVCAFAAIGMAVLRLSLRSV
jgi:hypothetical protein